MVIYDGKYDPIGWSDEYPETTIDLHIPEPESLIEYQSDQLTKVLETTQDLQKNIRDISLLARIAEANNIGISTESPLYKVISQMSKIPPDSGFEHLQYPEIFVLSETSQRAAKLLLGGETHTEVHNLKNKLVDLANRADNFLRPREEDEYDYEEPDDEECTYFNPYRLDVCTGEERLYNHTNTSNDDVPLLLTKYNIAEDEELTYFKSCGMFIEDEQSTSASIDFTPFNAVDPGEIDPTVAMAMAFMGMKNFLYALEKYQIGNNKLISLHGQTNYTMALFASRFGFDVWVDNMLLTKDEIKAKKDSLSKEETYWVAGSIDNIKRELEIFEKEGFAEKLIKRASRSPYFQQQ